MTTLTEQIAPEDEELVTRSCELIREEGRISTSLIQRRFRLGYTHATRIMDWLEKRGIIAPGDGAQPRKILAMPVEVNYVEPRIGNGGAQSSELSVVADEVRLMTGAVITRTGLRFERRPSLEEFRGTAEIVFGIFKHSRFITLDMLKVGRKEFGDATMRTVMREHGVSQTDMEEVFRLEQVVERRASLTAEHHFAVSRLDAIDQKRWLELAEMNDLSPRALRASIAAGEVVRPEAEQTDSKRTGRLSGTENHLTYMNAFNRWRSREDVTSWTPDWVQRVREDLKPVVEFYEELGRRANE